MSVNDFLTIDEKEKKQLWEVFLYEKVLDDNEKILLDDLNLYEERIRNIGTASTSIEINLLKVYMEHVKNIRALLLSFHNNRNETLKLQIEGIATDSSTES